LDQFMQENLELSPLLVTNLGMDTGAHTSQELTFLAQRDRAKKVLAAHYDIRKFHGAMLLPGSVPLELLEGIYA
jgi:hypothetical protein